MIIAIDPGRDKCGLAVLDSGGAVLKKTILARPELLNQLPAYLTKYGLNTLIVGRGHFGKQLARDLTKLEPRVNVIFVDEKDSTRQARKRYWRDHPPQGLAKLLPTSLRVPPVPVDDWAAVILGERYLED